jgi:hypothetical protein
MTEQKLLSDLIRNESKYRQLLKNLILEGLIKMLEPKVFIRYVIDYKRCLKRDQRLVESLVSECKSEFKKLIERDGIDSSLGEVDLQVDNRYSLQERNVVAEAGS